MTKRHCMYHPCLFFGGFSAPSYRFSDFLIASLFFNSNNCSRSLLAKNWRLCTQLTASACKIYFRVSNLLPCGYVIHSTSTFSKSNIQGLSAEQLEACIEDVNLTMIKNIIMMQTAFYTPLVCLSLVSWLPVACKLHLSGRQSHADCA